MTAAAVAGLLLALSACAPAARLDARWPRADGERTVAGPSSDALWPLTGKPALDDSAAASPAVMLAVSDTPAAASLPGLDSADVVFEITVGTSDVIAAVFHSSLPAAAGPLRDPTGPDATLAAAYRAKLVGRGQAGKALADVAALAAAPATGGAPPSVVAFASKPTGASIGSASQIDVPLAGGSTAEWRYDAGSGGYQRFVDAKPALAAGGRVIRTTNVIVMWVPPAAWPGAVMAGSGRASVFCGAGKYVGSWETSGGPPVFRDRDGAPIALLPGSTWIEVIGTATNIVLR